MNKTEPYISLEWIPATSVIAERSFSQSGLIYSELRQRLLPYILECLMFLKHNRNFWDVFTVATLINNNQTDDDQL